MPFAVFRRHQRKLLAIFAILAMFGFVLADSLPRLLSGGYGGPGANPVIVKLFGHPVRQSDLGAMAAERHRANRFMAELSGLPGQPFFGDTTTRALVDALLLEHEAEALKMPRGPELAREWLKQRTGGRMSRELFESTLTRIGVDVSGQQILADIADQVRLENARRLLGTPVVTPLDVFQAYRDQTELVSDRIASFPIERFVPQVREPTAQEVQAYYERYKDVLPDPTRDTPGFKVPRQIRVEFVALDGSALTRKIQDTLTDAELLSYYENRKTQFKQPSEFPDDIFAGDPQATLTPPLVQPFADVRPFLASSLAEEKAQTEIVNRLTKIQEEVMIPFVEQYETAVEKNTEAQKEGEKTLLPLPKPETLAGVARRAGLEHEITPLLSRDQAEHFGPISSAEVGFTRNSGGRKFAAEFFDAKSSLFEPVELTNADGMRFLARKIEDFPPRVPSLEEIRPEVVRAWKLDQARPLARKAAEDFAAQVRRNGGRIKEDVVQGLPVITTEPVTRLQPGFPLPGRFFESSAPTPTEFRQITAAGDEFRDAYFGLRPGDVAVAPNRPKTVYYVLTLNRRDPASFAALYAPNGDYIRFQRETFLEALKRRDDEWMGALRKKAGLDPNWVPKDELNRESAADRG
jgi:peptidyl-prolyl cis-trans isomerase D